MSLGFLTLSFYFYIISALFLQVEKEYNKSEVDLNNKNGGIKSALVDDDEKDRKKVAKKLLLASKRKLFFFVFFKFVDVTLVNFYNLKF